MFRSKFSLNEFTLNSHTAEGEPSIKDKSTTEIAVIGMAVKFPHADSLDKYWMIIENGLECVTGLPEERKQDIDRYLEFLNKSDGVKYLQEAYIDNIDKFDHEFFQMSPKEASLMNPIHRLFLQVAWSSLEDAGYGGKKITGSNTGIYLGFISDMEGYKYREMIHEVDPYLIPVSVAGNLSSMMASRIAYYLNLKGPSMLIDTACSSSLVAVDLACKALQNGTCEMALAGGARLGLFPIDKEYYKFGIESSDYTTRTFDDNSDGSGLGEGVAAVLLKPLDKAIRDHDSIYAVIKGSVTNQDGTTMGITAPNPQAQADLLTAAWEKTGIDPETLDYIEAHGTGTKLGDTIEIEAIQKAFQKYTHKKQFCAIGSVKTNLGHLYEGAGIAGLIKAILSLKNKKIPPSVNFKKVNKQIDFEDSPVYVNIKLKEWSKKDHPRRCGVSSFGISGTNCHVILEEAPDTNRFIESNGNEIFTISAQNKMSLYEMIIDLKEYLQNKSVSLTDVCYSLNVGRGQYRHRVAFSVNSMDELISKLDQLVKIGLDEAQRINIFYGEHKVVSEAKDRKEKNELTEIQKRELDNRVETLLINNSDKRSNTAIQSEICHLYVGGADLDWDMFYMGKRYQKINLPGYKFVPKRCWIEIPQFTNQHGKDAEKSMYYGIGWKPEHLKTVDVEKFAEAVLIFMDDKGLGQQIAENYREKGTEVWEIHFAKGCTGLSENQYLLDGVPEDYAKIANRIKEMGISKIIHLSSLNDHFCISSVEDFDQCYERGMLSLYRLSKALIDCMIDRVIDVVMVSDYTCEVDGAEERLKPENAILFGFGKVLKKENPNIFCRCIDLDDYTNLIDLMNEFEVPTNHYHVAYRRGVRYIQEFREVGIDQEGETELVLKRDGVYLITGGTGGIGLEIAKFLGKKDKVNIALLSKAGMPEKKQWANILSEGKDAGTILKIQRVQELESMGLSLIFCKADVSDMEAMKRVLADLRKEFGKINGVIHGAGIAVHEFIANKQVNEMQCVLRPKVQGTWILDQLTSQDELDFFVLFSSIATIFEAPGQADYVAANSYLDAYADYRNKNGNRTLTVNWATWKETGMAARSGMGIDTLFKSMQNQVAIDCFEEVLSKEIRKVLIGEINYEGELIHLLDKNEFDLSLTIKERLNNRKQKVQRKMGTKKSSSEVTLLGREGEKYTDIELVIARICKETLGYDEINIYDSFFEMGADSILLKQLYTRIDECYPGKLAIAQIFEYSSIIKLSKFIADQDTKNEVIYEDKNKNIQDEVTSILDQMENGNMTLDDILSKIEEI